MIQKQTSPWSYVTSILFLDMFLIYTKEDTWYTSEKTLCEVHFFVAHYKTNTGKFEVRVGDFGDNWYVWKLAVGKLGTNRTNTDRLQVG